MFEKTLIAGWGDMDFNSHMRNTAFLDKSADIRMMYFEESGFPMAEFIRRRIGPIIMKDELEYYKEVGLLEPLKGTLRLAGLADDGSRFELCNEFYKADGKLAARVSSLGGWLNLDTRKLVAPPEMLLRAINAISRDEGFKILPSSIK